MNLFKTCFSGSTPRVSILTITGKICDFDDIEQDIDSAFNQPNLRAVCLRINSPGGSPVQSHLIAEYIRIKAAVYQVPVYCFVEDMAASGGYLVACAATSIFVSRFSTVGSIGVTMTSFSVTKLLDKLGIDRKVYTTAGSLKGRLNRNLLSEAHQEFINYVKDSRAKRLLLEESDALFSGAVFGAERAIKLGLVDGLYTVLKIKIAELVDGSFKLVEIGNKKQGFGLRSLFGIKNQLY